MYYRKSYLRVGIRFSQSNEYICSQRDGTCLTTLSTVKREFQLEGTEVLVQGLLMCTFYKMVCRRLFKYSHSLLQGILIMYPRLLLHHGRENTRGQGTGESCRTGVSFICVCPANKGKSKTKVERAFPQRASLMLHARLVIACTPLKTTKNNNAYTQERTVTNLCRF